METAKTAVEKLNLQANVQETSPLQVSTFNPNFIPTPLYWQHVYTQLGIPPRICALSHDDLDTDNLAAPLWKNVLERATGIKNGYSQKRGLFISGNQGAGKSTALYFLARATVKALISGSPPSDTKSIPQVPVVIKYFKEWVRMEFVTVERGATKYNFDLLYDFLRAKAIFLDDLTFDSSRETFAPVREFLDILIEKMTREINPPLLYITTNNTASEWDSLLGSQLVDRICGKTHGLCEIVKCDWKSFR